MSRGAFARAVVPRVCPGPGPHYEAHSVHLLREPHIDRRPVPLKPDRLLVGVLAGAGLFYLLGRAMGLGRR